MLGKILLFNKPYGVLSQFTGKEGRPTLAQYIPVPGVYAAGRLDADSEGLLVLTDDGRLQRRICDPCAKLAKSYWVQVEGVPGRSAVRCLETGIELRDGRTAPARARPVQPPTLWPRNPPVRFRGAIPTAWIEITLSEGRNRQVRRMTAAVGHPTLRLIRWRVGPWTLNGLAPGQWRVLGADAADVIKSSDDLDTPYHRGRHRGARRPVPHRRGGDRR